MHFHTALHIQGATKLIKENDEVLAFTDKYISCQLPASNKDLELHTLVPKLQQHHNTCEKKACVSCRFSYPKPPSSISSIAHFPGTKYAKVLLDQAIQTLQKVFTVLPKNDFENGE